MTNPKGTILWPMAHRPCTCEWGEFGVMTLCGAHSHYEQKRCAGFIKAGEIADSAIEFGELLATAADGFMAAVNHRAAAQRLSDFGAEQEADAAMTDHWKALQDAVYEFRKRATKAGHKPSAEKFNR